MRGVGFGFLTTLGVGFLCLTATPDVRLDHFLHHTPKSGIPVEMVQFLLKLAETVISCCAPRFPLILTAEFHSLFVEESESEILESRRLGVGNFGKVGHRRIQDFFRGEQWRSSITCHPWISAILPPPHPMLVSITAGIFL